MKSPGADTDYAEEKLVRGQFAGWKLDVAHALATDPELKASDIRVGVAMLRFLNAGTLTLYPSQERLAKLTHMSINNLVSCLNRLKLAGWIKWARGNRQLANVYSFEPNHIAEQIARVKKDEQAHKANRKRRRPTSDPQPTVGQKQKSDPQPTVVRDPQPAGGQHLNGTPTSDLEDVA